VPPTAPTSIRNSPAGNSAGQNPAQERLIRIDLEKIWHELCKDQTPAALLAQTGVWIEPHFKLCSRNRNGGDMNYTTCRNYRNNGRWALTLLKVLYQILCLILAILKVLKQLD